MNVSGILEPFKSRFASNENYFYLMDYKGEIFHESTDRQSVEILCSRLNKRLEDEFDDNGGMGNDPFFYVAYVPDMDYGKVTDPSDFHGLPTKNEML